MGRVKLLASLFILICGYVFMVMGSRVLRQTKHKTELDPSLEFWQPTDELMMKFPYYLSGFDEEERPIWIIEFGKWNIRKELERGEEYQRNLSRYIDQAFWRLSKSIELRSTPEYPVTDGVGIFDMQHYDLLQLASVPALTFIFAKAREIEPTTPHMEKGYFLNVNFVAQTLLNFLKPVLGTFFAKSEIYGTNSAVIRRSLIKSLPRSSLPPHYGGDPDFKPIVAYG